MVPALPPMPDPSDPIDPIATDLKPYLSSRRGLIEETLGHILRAHASPSKQLDEAMRYALLGGGKRVRPILFLACAEAVFPSPDPALLERLLPFACALECIHTYSLIHDDLPAMDNDDVRRGRPTCHKRFDEATAILAGDALLTLAFQLAAHPTPGVPSQHRLWSIGQLAQGAGMGGMVGGQMLDMMAENRSISLSDLKTIHDHKTGALIRVACATGAHLGGGTSDQRQRLTTYGEAIGLAFQITDDMLDETGDSRTLGKATGQDRYHAKATYVRLLGLRGAQQEAERQVARALGSLESYADSANPLRLLARFILTRNY